MPLTIAEQNELNDLADVFQPVSQEIEAGTELKPVSQPEEVAFKHENLSIGENVELQALEAKFEPRERPEQRQFQNAGDEFVRALARGTLNVGSGLLTAVAQAGGPGAVFDPSRMQELADKARELSQSPKFQPGKTTGKVDAVGAFVANAVGDALPFMAGVIGATLATGPVGGFGVAFAVEGANAYQDALDAGASQQDAETEGFIVGAINASLELLQVERVLRFAKAGKGSVKSIFKAAKTKSLKKIAAAGKDFGVEALKLSVTEGVQEALQETASTFAPVLTGRALPEEGKLKRILQAGLGGAVAGPILGGAGAVVQSIMDGQTELSRKEAKELGVIEPTTAEERKELIPKIKAAVEAEIGEADAERIARQAEQAGEEVGIEGEAEEGVRVRDVAEGEERAEAPVKPKGRKFAEADVQADIEALTKPVAEKKGRKKKAVKQEAVGVAEGVLIRISKRIQESQRIRREEAVEKVEAKRVIPPDKQEAVTPLGQFLEEKGDTPSTRLDHEAAVLMSVQGGVEPYKGWEKDYPSIANDLADLFGVPRPSAEQVQKPKGRKKAAVEKVEKVTVERVGEKQRTLEFKIDALTDSKDILSKLIELTERSGPSKKLTKLEKDLDALDARIKEGESLLKTEKGFGAKNTAFTKQQFEKDKAAEAEAEPLRGKPKKGQRKGAARVFTAEDLKRAGRIAGFYFEGGLREFGAWSAKLIEVLGSPIKPHLEKLWAQAKKDVETFEAEAGFDDVAEIKPKATGTIKVKLKKAGRIKSKSTLAKEQAEALAEEGIVTDDTYDQTKNIPEREAAEDFVSSNLDDARRIALGDESNVGDLLPNAVRIAYFNKMMDEGNVAEAKRVYDVSFVTNVRKGQDISVIQAFVNEYSTFSAVKKVAAAKRAAVARTKRKRGNKGSDAAIIEKEIADGVSKLSRLTEDKRMDVAQMNKFLDNLEC